jgi:hypothetical protein
MYKKQKNPVVRREVQILEAEKYNHSVREVHPVKIGNTRKLTKNKCRKNNNHVIHEEVQEVLPRSTSTYYTKYKR